MKVAAHYLTDGSHVGSGDLEVTVMSVVRSTCIRCFLAKKKLDPLSVAAVGRDRHCMASVLGAVGGIRWAVPGGLRPSESRARA